MMEAGKGCGQAVKRAMKLTAGALAVGFGLPLLTVCLRPEREPAEREPEAQTVEVTQAPSGDKLCTLQVLMEDGSVSDMALDEYLAGVLLAEIPASFAPEAIKAQAVVSRTYTLRRTEHSKHQEADICTNPGCCQGWRDPADYAAREGQTGLETMNRAIGDTDGQVLTYEGELIDATFFSCSGGRTEAAVEVWGSDVPYLQSVDSPGEEAPYNEDLEVFTPEAFAAAILEVAPEADKVRAAGGLFILGTERHESRRIDNQLRGRSGRQGDPGESKFFISLEDDLMRLFGNNERIIAMIDKLGIDEDTPIEARLLSNTIESAQKRIEDQNFKRRKYVLSYDDVMNQQRNLIYKQRQQVLDDQDLTETIRRMIHETVETAVAAHTSEESPMEWDLNGLRASLIGYLCGDDDFRYTEEELKKLRREDLQSMLTERADRRLEAQETLFTPDTFAPMAETFKERIRIGAQWDRAVARKRLRAILNLHSAVIGDANQCLANVDCPPFPANVIPCQCQAFAHPQACFKHQ